MNYLLSKQGGGSDRAESRMSISNQQRCLAGANKGFGNQKERVSVVSGCAGE